MNANVTVTIVHELTQIWNQACVHARSCMEIDEKETSERLSAQRRIHAQTDLNVQAN
jgi:hypothetical protein